MKSIEADYLIFSDVRFSAEADGILTEGGLLFRIDNPNQPKVIDGADEPLENYQYWTGIIDNSANYQYLYDQIDTIVKEYF